MNKVEGILIIILVLALLLSGYLYLENTGLENKIIKIAKHTQIYADTTAVYDIEDANNLKEINEPPFGVIYEDGVFCMSEDETALLADFSDLRRRYIDAANNYYSDVLGELE